MTTSTTTKLYTDERMSNYECDGMVTYNSDKRTASVLILGLRESRKTNVHISSKCGTAEKMNVVITFKAHGMNMTCKLELNNG